MKFTLDVLQSLTSAAFAMAQQSVKPSVVVGGDQRAKAQAGEVVACKDQAHVSAENGATVYASGRSTVNAGRGSKVFASGEATVDAIVGSNVTAEGQSTVHVRHGSTVTAKEGVTAHLYDHAHLDARRGAQVRLEDGTVLVATKDTSLSVVNGVLTADRDSVQVVHGSQVIETNGPSPGRHAALPVYDPAIKRPSKTFDKSKPYLSKRHMYPPRNLNAKAVFPATAGASGGRTIVCRHLATQYAHDILHSPRGKVDLDKFSSADKISQHVPTGGKEEDYDNAIKYAKEAYFTNTNQLGELLIPQFKKIEAEGQHQVGERGLLIDATDHVMAIRLRVKNHSADANKKIYVVNFYDPNFSDAIVRCEVDDLSKLTDQTLRQYIDGNGKHGSAYTRYFGADHHAVAYVCNAQATGPEPLATNTGRALTRRHDEEITPALMFHLLNGNFPADVASLAPRIAKLDSAKQLEILSAVGMDGTSGLYRALQSGHADVIQAYAALLKQLPDTPGKARLLATLLEAKGPNGTPALYMALQNGHVGAIRAFGEMLALLLDGPEKASLMAELLAAKNADGVPGLFIALQQGHAKAIHEFGELLTLLPNTPETAHLIGELLMARLKDGKPGFFMALQKGRGDAIKAFVKLLSGLPAEQREWMKNDFLEGKFEGRSGRDHLMEFGSDVSAAVLAVF
jgi:hypothetical protein